MFSNNNKNRKCRQKCDVTATLLVFQKNGTAALLVTTPADPVELRFSFAPTNLHRCWSRE